MRLKMEQQDKLQARRLREREKRRNESPEQRATRLQVSRRLCIPVHYPTRDLREGKACI